MQNIVGRLKERRGGGERTNAASLLAGGLVEPCLDIVLPVLLEVPVGDDVVVLHHFALFLSFLPARQQRNIDSNGVSRDEQQTTREQESTSCRQLHLPPSLAAQRSGQSEARCDIKARMDTRRTQSHKRIESISQTTGSAKQPIRNPEPSRSKIRGRIAAYG
jgi:hypothetical protein